MAKIKKKPKPLAPSDLVGRTIGQSTALRKGPYFLKLMKENFKAHLSDEKLAAALKKEFPKATSPWIDRIAGIRNAFNNGIITGQDSGAPHTQLVRYGDDGQPYKRQLHNAKAKAKPVAKKDVVKVKPKLKIKAKPKVADPALLVSA